MAKIVTISIEVRMMYEEMRNRGGITPFWFFLSNPERSPLHTEQRLTQRKGPFTPF